MTKPSLWSDLKRRHVVKVFLVYAVVAVAVVEAADLMFPRLTLPDWTVTLVVALAVIGLPIALVLAWAFEITPEGVQRDRGAGADPRPAGAAPTGAVASPAMRTDPSPTAHAEATPPIEGNPGSASAADREDGPGSSIAVLSFADMSPEQDQGYFCDGVAEEIIDALTRVEGLDVAARTSAFAFKGRDASVQTIGDELGVAVVLEGSVRKAGEQIRVTAQLIQASNGYHLWSERYDRELRDIFAVQEEIARAVVERMRASLGEGVEAPTVKAQTADPEAYRLYLQGRHYWNQRYKVGLERGLEYFDKALQRDPEYALAHAGVADSYTLMAFYGILPLDTAFPRAEASAARALDLDEDLAESWLCNAILHFWHDWDFERSEREFRRAIELRPEWALPRVWLAQQLGTLGRVDEGKALVAEGLALAPHDTLVASLAGGSLAFCGQSAEAVDVLQPILEREPDAVFALWMHGVSLTFLGRTDESVPVIERCAELTRRNGPVLATLGAALAAAGRREEAQAILAELDATGLRYGEAGGAYITSQLADLNLLVEDWGGDIQSKRISAKTGEGVDDLLELLALQAEMSELVANPDAPAVGAVIEGHVHKGRGPVATVLVKEGTLEPGEIVVVGENIGRVRAMITDGGKKVKEAGPSTPVEILGLDGVPAPGDELRVAPNLDAARELAAHRIEKRRSQELAGQASVSLQDLFDRINAGEQKELKIVIKADLHGTAEALKDALTALTTKKVRVNVISSGVGGVVESDVEFAKASEAIIIGFAVRPDTKALKSARALDVDIRTYNIIYEAVDEVRLAMQGLLAPVTKEKYLGRAEVRATFQVPKIGTVAGCGVVDGIITRSANIRLLRTASRSTTASSPA